MFPFVLYLGPLFLIKCWDDISRVYHSFEEITIVGIKRLGQLAVVMINKRVILSGEQSCLIQTLLYVELKQAIVLVLSSPL